MKIISLAKRKGGTGASTMTILLATALAKYDAKRVLILDVDAQRTVAALADMDERKGLKLLVKVVAIEPTKVQVYLKEWGEGFDIVFLDLPRMTDDSKDDVLVKLMYLCDSLLLPVVPSQLSVLATLPFLEGIKDIVKRRKELGFETKLYGFLSLATRRAYTNDTRDFFLKQGLDMFEHRIDNVKVFSRLSLADSIMDIKEGRIRFEPFYKEFLTKFEI